MMEKRVLVTGASRGIGRAIAKTLAKEGWCVAIHYVSAEREAESLAEELGDRHAGTYRTDLSKPASARQLVESALIDAPLDALVNNAGIYEPVEFLALHHEAALEAAQHSLNVNFLSPMVLAHAAARHFVGQGGGKILNVTSRVGFRGEAGAAFYAASKAALINLTRSLAVELAPIGVGVFGIAPGWVETAMGREGMGDRLPEILATIPLQRMASPEDCAAAAAFLLRDEASYLSGVVMDINGASYFH